MKENIVDYSSDVTTGCQQVKSLKGKGSEQFGLAVQCFIVRHHKCFLDIHYSDIVITS